MHPQKRNMYILFYDWTIKLLVLFWIICVIEFMPRLTSPERGRTVGRFWLEPGSLMITCSRRQERNTTVEWPACTPGLNHTEHLWWLRRVHWVIWWDSWWRSRTGYPKPVYSAWYTVYGIYARRALQQLVDPIVIDIMKTIHWFKIPSWVLYLYDQNTKVLLLAPDPSCTYPILGMQILVSMQQCINLIRNSSLHHVVPNILGCHP